MSRCLRPLARTALALSTLGGLAACDDSAVDEGFQGALLATYTVQIVNADRVRDRDTPLEPPEGLRVALFWQLGGLRGSVVVEHPSSGIEPTERDSVITLREPPPSEALMDDTWAIARVVGYIDADGDDIKGPDEGIYSEMSGAVLLFALRDLGAAESPTGAPLTAGLHRQWLPLICDPATLPAPTGGDCGVPFGLACVVDETDCGAGVCYSGMARAPQPGYACGLNIEDAGDCHPSEAAFRPRWNGDPDVLSGQYLQRCTAQADCPAGNSCDPLGGYCVTGPPSQVFLPGDTALMPLCVEDDSPEVLVRSYPGARTTPPGGGGMPPR